MKVLRPIEYFSVTQGISALLAETWLALSPTLYADGEWELCPLNSVDRILSGQKIFLT